MGALFTETKCPICKKEFIFYPSWAYKRGDVHFCTYSCLKAYDMRTTRGSEKRLNKDERSELLHLLELGSQPKHVARKFGISLSAVLYYQSKARA